MRKVTLRRVCGVEIEREQEREEGGRAATHTGHADMAERQGAGEGTELERGKVRDDENAHDLLGKESSGQTRPVR